MCAPTKLCVQRELSNNGILTSLSFYAHNVWNSSSKVTISTVSCRSEGLHSIVTFSDKTECVHRENIRWKLKRSSAWTENRPIFGRFPIVCRNASRHTYKLINLEWKDMLHLIGLECVFFSKQPSKERACVQRTLWVHTYMIRVCMRLVVFDISFVWQCWEKNISRIYIL